MTPDRPQQDSDGLYKAQSQVPEESKVVQEPPTSSSEMLKENAYGMAESGAADQSSS